MKQRGIIIIMQENNNQNVERGGENECKSGGINPAMVEQV